MGVAMALHLWCPACFDVTEHAVFTEEPGRAACNLCGTAQALEPPPT